MYCLFSCDENLLLIKIGIIDKNARKVNWIKTFLLNMSDFDSRVDMIEPALTHIKW